MGETSPRSGSLKITCEVEKKANEERESKAAVSKAASLGGLDNSWERQAMRQAVNHSHVPSASEGGRRLQAVTSVPPLLSLYACVFWTAATAANLS